MLQGYNCLSSPFQLEHLPHDYNGSALSLIESLSRYETILKMCRFIVSIWVGFIILLQCNKLGVMDHHSDVKFFFDSLVVMGNNTEFERAVLWLSDNLKFDVDARINLFEVSN